MKFKRVNIADYMFFQEGPGVRKTQFTTTGVKLMNVGNINNGRLSLSATKLYISESEAYGKYKHFLLEDGDLIIGSSGITVDNFHNKIAWVNSSHLPLCLNTSTIRFRPLDKLVVDGRFFAYYLQTSSFKSELAKLITGSAQLNFGPSHIKQMTMPLPSLHIQQQIADTLDKADALRQKDQQVFQKYDQLVQSIFYDMVGDPIKNEKGWKVLRFGDSIKSIKAGTSIGGEEGQERRNTEVAVLKISAVTSGIFKPNEYKVPKQHLLPKELVTIRKGDLLFSRANTRELVGAVAIPDSDLPYLMLPDKLWRIDLDKNKMNPYYVKTLLWDKGVRFELTKTATGTSGSMLNISMEKLKNLLVPVPPLEVQTQFAKAASDVLRQKLLLESVKEKSNLMFSGLMLKYFS